ncbi:response regulator [Propionibacterium cyclohexanicum]|uniref:response regulator n=1 Tax=Propionibacterium cyclohexanicum TaxID=64702 RepID=UPI001FDEE7AC|nr:response regulator transcription factor [Propionibacterium cyclohexanicum]
MSRFDDLDLRWAVRDGQQAVDRLTDGNPDDQVDVLLLDVQMPVLGGIPACRLLQAVRPKPPVIMLTTFEAAGFLAEALDAGAIGFLTKDEAPERIADAIRAARAGNGVFSPSATSALTSVAGSVLHEKSPNPLTAKEMDVLCLVVESLTNRQIAARLGVSEATVKTHISAILTKLDCADRVGMVTWAFRSGAI